MLKLSENDLLDRIAIGRVQFENKYYFSIEDIAMEFKEDLSGVKGIILPINEKYQKAATIEELEKGLKKKPLKEELSDFNQALLKARNFKEDQKKDKEN